MVLLPRDMLFLVNLLAKELRELVSMAMSTSVLTSSAVYERELRALSSPKLKKSVLSLCEGCYL